MRSHDWTFELGTYHVLVKSFFESRALGLQKKNTIEKVSAIQKGQND